MTLQQAEMVLDTLQKLIIDESLSAEEQENAQDRKTVSIAIMRAYIGQKEHQQLKIDMGVGMLDSLEECPKCGELSLVSKMSGGYECKLCGYGEIAFQTEKRI